MDDLSLSSQPFQYSIPLDTFDPIREGIGLGAKAALALAMFYAMGVALFIVFTEWNLIPIVTMRDFWAVGAAVAEVYGGTLMVFGLAMVLGGIPALVIGVIGGGLIGFTCRFIKTRLPRHRAWWYGFWVSAMLLGVRIGIFAWANGFEYFRDDLTDSMMWLTWFAPNIGAFFGFWWVAYKINERMPTP